MNKYFLILVGGLITISKSCNSGSSSCAEDYILRTIQIAVEDHKNRIYNSDSSEIGKPLRGNSHLDGCVLNKLIDLNSNSASYEYNKRKFFQNEMGLDTTHLETIFSSNDKLNYDDRLLYDILCNSPVNNQT